MKVLVRIVLSSSLLSVLLLSGCSWGLVEDASSGLQGTFSVQIISDGPQPSVVVRAHDRHANWYHWEFYDVDSTEAPRVIEGKDKSVATHTWPEVGPGAYLIVLTVEIRGSEDGPGGGGGCCGPGPGGAGGGGGSGSSDEEQTASSFQVVRFAGCANLVPILFFTTWNGGRTGTSFYPWEKICVNALESIGEELTYKIEIVRVVSVNDPTPIPPDWSSTVEYIRTELPLYCFYIPGPGGCSGEVWTYRVTLRIRDKWWKEATVTKFIFAGCCP